MSGTYPTNPTFQAVNFRINTPTLSSETLSGKTRRVGMGVSFYTFAAQYNNMTDFDMGPIVGFLHAQYGQLEDFQIVLPRISFSKAGNQTTNTVTTTQARTTGQNSVTVTGPSAGQSLLLAGDFFKFNNHSKVYMCTTDWTPGQPLRFAGSLVSDVPSGTALTITNVPFTVILDNDVQEFQVGLGGISQLQVDFREVW
jgi:hypothetical protein